MRKRCTLRYGAVPYTVHYGAGAKPYTEEGVGEEKTIEKALEEYRQILQDTFGSSEALDFVMIYVEGWIDGV